MDSTFGLIKKRNISLIILFFLWAALFIKFFIAQSKSISPLCMFYAYNEEEKYEFIDGGFYTFMKSCRDLVPRNSDVGFGVYPKEPLLYSIDWYLKEYFIQKCPYYLFPRKIYDIEFYKDKILEYKIIYNPQLKDFYLYRKDKLICHVTY